MSTLVKMPHCWKSHVVAQLRISGSGGSMFDSARQRYYIAAMEKLYNYAGQIIEDRMEFRQYLCERKEEIMEQLYSLMEDIITQLLKV